MDNATDRHFFQHKRWLVEVFVKNSNGKQIPLKFNIYYEGQKINSLVGIKHVKAIDEAIHEMFGGRIEDLN